jgi:hypothetical protein
MYIYSRHKLGVKKLFADVTSNTHVFRCTSKVDSNKISGRLCQWAPYFISRTILMYCTFSPVFRISIFPFDLPLQQGNFMPVIPTKITLGLSVLIGYDAASRTDSFPKFRDTLWSRNFGNQLPSDAASYPRETDTSATPLEGVGGGGGLTKLHFLENVCVHSQYELNPILHL